MLGSVAQQTLVAAALAWLATRMLRCAAGVALLAALIAGASGLAERRAVDVGGVGRVTRCDAPALLELIRQLPDAIARGSRSTRVARCHAHRTRAPTRTGRR